jgi:ribonuclease HI
VRWTWVRGHTGEIGNERADRLAAQGRREALSAPAGAAPASTVSLTASSPAPDLTAAAPTAPARLKGTAALAAGLAAAPRTTQVPVDLALGPDIARAAKAAGLTAPAFVEAAIRVALHLGPEAFARAHAAAKGTPAP